MKPVVPARRGIETFIDLGLDDELEETSEEGSLLRRRNVKLRTITVGRWRGSLTGLAPFGCHFRGAIQALRESEDCWLKWRRMPWEPDGDECND